MYSDKTHLINGIKDKPVCILFYANWCHYCNLLKPKWNDILNKYKNSNVFSVQDTEISKLNNSYNIDGYPKIIISKNGEEISEFSGEQSYDNISNFIRKYIKEKKKSNKKTNKKKRSIRKSNKKKRKSK